MQFFYNIAILLYRGIVRLIAPFKGKANLLKEGHRNLFETLSARIDPKVRYCWFHASSLGEFEQGRPVMEAMKKADPSLHILLTFFSPSGYEVRKNWEVVDVVSYLPFDTPTNVVRFLDLVRPEMAVFIKYEFWANYLHELKRREIPTFLISGIFRPTQLFFRSYGGFYRNLLTCFTKIYLQDDTSRQLLANIGVTHTQVCGDTRFDRVRGIRTTIRPLPVAQRFAESAERLFVVGSSWPEDEMFILPYINKRSDIKLIIAPHEIDENHLQNIENRLTRPSLRYSQASESTVSAADVLIIDSFGLLSSLYRYGVLAYVGGGFGAGIHNIAEAAVYGIPVLFGPKNQKFKEASELKLCRGGVEVADGDEFERIMNWFLDNPDSLEAAGKAAESYIASHSGATRIISEELLAMRS